MNQIGQQGNNTDSFHNTINESGDTLIKSEEACKTQEDKILKIFREKPGIAMTPFYVQDLYQELYPNVPITSIRRAMTNLTEQNKLIKTRNMKKEFFGKKNFLWTYNESFGR